MNSRGPVVFVYSHKASVQHGPHRAHVYAQNDLEGVMENPCIHPKYTYFEE
jgi:hypothetical protein